MQTLLVVQKDIECFTDNAKSTKVFDVLNKFRFCIFCFLFTSLLVVAFCCCFLQNERNCFYLFCSTCWLFVFPIFLLILIFRISVFRLFSFSFTLLFSDTLDARHRPKKLRRTVARRPLCTPRSGYTTYERTLYISPDAIYLLYTACRGDDAQLTRPKTR